MGLRHGPMMPCPCRPANGSRPADAPADDAATAARDAAHATNGAMYAVDVPRSYSYGGA